MKYPNNKINFRNIAILLLLCLTGILGYLYYDLHSTNIKDKQVIKLAKEENLDMSQDLEIYKDKYDKLKEEINSLKSKVSKVSYKKHLKKKRYISSAGRSSKSSYHHKHSKINYRKLYFKLKSQCSKHKNKANRY